MKIEFKWEGIFKSNNMATERSKVIGGWIIRTINWSKIGDNQFNLAESMIFVTDPEHKWEI